ncbi:MAG: hypothetical protein US63_C0032G0002 [Candidatus Moranbacteria bacterium GW2011_GWC2_37_8]|nr:MAG: hypothetical protein US63_C0032G0002 [Candidatus Moranbacteria bacterium GW2011_GWC2_37_8]KKQ60690.1 MAG: hypothetical protein US82_C0030G0003 [Parcubacteria group bacterium GW2011_GWC1_38_22]
MLLSVKIELSGVTPEQLIILQRDHNIRTAVQDNAENKRLTFTVPFDFSTLGAGSREKFSKLLDMAEIQEV